ncbi:MAG TPA: transglycosylase family protein [Solirubrobacterales bacterium]|nr:transglycosylase family protein [Solirubrobacterales bacterium]
MLILLSFPAVAFAAGSGGGSEPAIGPARPAAAAPQVPAFQRASDFNRLVERASQRMRAERRAAAERRAREERERFEELPGGVSIATLESIASCESGGDPTVVSSDGTYRGKYQFDYGTWESVGGSGDPAAAPEAEQDYRAALLYERAGSSPWPVCG